MIKTALFEDIIFFSMLMLTLKGIFQMKKKWLFFINLAQNFILAKLSAKLACADNFLLKMLDITHGSFSNVPMVFCRNGKNLRTEKHKNHFWVRLSIRHAKSVSNYWCMGFNSVQLQFANLLKAFLLFVKLLWTTIIKNDSCTLLTMLNIHNNTSRISSENALQSHFWVNKVSLKPIFVPSKNQSMFLPTIWKIMI